MNEFMKQKIKIARARYNIMFMAVLSIINILLISAGKTLTMPFSSSIATYATVIGINVSKENSTESYRLIGFAISAFVILILLLCHLFSKNKPFWFFVSFSLIAADTAVLITFSFVSGALQLLTVLDLALHVLTLYYIFNAIKAHSILSKMPSLSENESQNSSISSDDRNKPDETLSNEEYAPSEEEDDEEEEEEEDLTKPIGKYEGDYSYTVLSGEYKKLKINAIIEQENALLVINGYICDSLDVEYTDEYILRAIINGIDISFEFKRTHAGEVMYLYADDELIDSLGRQ